MSENSCPLCGGNTKKEEYFCKVCQDNAIKSSPEKLLKGALSIEVKKKDPISEDIVIESPSISAPNISPNYISSKDNWPLRGLVMVALVVAGIVSYLCFNYIKDEKENSYWAECIDTNTSLGYADYLQKYPIGQFSFVAEEKMRELKQLELKNWNSIKLSNDIEGLRSYLIEYPNTPYANDAKNKIDKLAWQVATKENTADSYKAYMENATINGYGGGFSDIATQRYNYYSKMEFLEGNEKDTIMHKAEMLLDALAANQKEKLATSLSQHPTSFLGIRNLEKNVLIDSLSRNYTRYKDIEKREYDMIEEQTSITKDINDEYFISTSILQKNNYATKGVKTTIDTLNFNIKLNKKLEVENLVAVK